MKRTKYIFLKIYWVAWFEVNVMKLLGLPKFEYAWWESRLNKIRRGEIKKGE